MKELYLPTATNDMVWAVVGSVGWFLCGYLVLVNLAAFALMGIDKRRAKREGMRRIPEKTLILAAVLGGSIGAIAGMYAFRHKTKHWYFAWGMPLILAAQITLAIWLIL